MLSSLISPAQLLADADRVTYLPGGSTVVRGTYNQVFLREVASVKDAEAKLAALGYVVTREWLEGCNGAQETYIRRAA